MSTITLKKQGSYIYIHREGYGFLRYNLKTLSLEKPQGAIWIAVSKQYKFFRGCKISDIVAEEKFLELIKLAGKHNNRCSNISTFISKLKDFMVYENYIIEGIGVTTGYGFNGVRHITRPLQDYNKNIKSLIKATGYAVNPDFEDKYFAEDATFRNMLETLYTLEIPNDIKKLLVERMVHGFAVFLSLVNEHNYNVKALFNYIGLYLMPFEGISAYAAPVLLRDYYSMASRMGRNVKRYPRYLQSMHGIITQNFDAYKKEYNEELFKEVQKPELCYSDSSSEYCVIAPMSSKELISEGTSLNHCVASYVDKVIEDRTLIMFLRKKDKMSESLVTLEITDGVLTQAKGSYNRNVTDDELKFITKYAKAKQLALRI